MEATHAFPRPEAAVRVTVAVVHPVVGPIRLYLAQVIAIGFLVVIMAGFAVFYRYTRSGIAMRAAAMDPIEALRHE